MSKSHTENWKSNRGMAAGREGIERRGKASDYWEDKDPAVFGLTAPFTSGAPHPSLQARHPIPSRQGNFLLPTTQPSSIYPSIHLSFPQQMEIITHNNTTTNNFTVPPFFHLASKYQILGMTALLIRALKSVPMGGKRYVWITQRM